MSVEFGWIDLEENVMSFNFRGKWSAEDLYENLDELSKLVEEKSYPVQLIIDMSYSITPPPNLMILLRTAFKKFPPNIEQAIVISKSQFWRRVFVILDESKLVPFPVQFVANANEAYNLLGDFI